MGLWWKERPLIRSFCDTSSHSRVCYCFITCWSPGSRCAALIEFLLKRKQCCSRSSTKKCISCCRLYPQSLGKDAITDIQASLKYKLNPVSFIFIHQTCVFPGVALFLSGHRRLGPLQIQQCHSSQILHPGWDDVTLHQGHAHPIITWNHRSATSVGWPYSAVGPGYWCLCVCPAGKVGDEECAVVYPPNGKPATLHSHHIISCFKGF